MKKHIKAIVPLIVFTFFMTSSLVAETVAVVLKVQGTIQLYRSGKVSDQSVKRGFRLQDGDKLVTGPKAFACGPALILLKFIKQGKHEADIVVYGWG